MTGTIVRPECLRALEAEVMDLREWKRQAEADCAAYRVALEFTQNWCRERSIDFIADRIHQLLQRPNPGQTLLDIAKAAETLDAYLHNNDIWHDKPLGDALAAWKGAKA